MNDGRTYRYEVFVLLYDEQSGRKHPCIISSVNGEIDAPDDPRGLLTAHALQDAAGRAAGAARFI